MGLKLSNFEATGGLELDTWPTPAREGVRLSDNTTATLAATDTMLSGSSLEDFEPTQAQLTNMEGRSEFLRKNVALRDAAFSRALEEVPAIISDPQGPVETKILAMNALQRDPNTDRNTPLHMEDELAVEAAVAPGTLGETEETDEYRSAMIDIIPQVNARKRLAQQSINALGLGQDGMGAQVWDMVEFVAPFAEWINIDRLLADMNEGDAQTGFLGEQKRALFNQIKSLPLNERAEFTEKVLEMVQAHDTMVLGSNDLVTLDILDKMVAGGQYSDTEYWFDQVTSMLEAVGVGMLARGALGGLRVARVTEKAAQAARTASEVATRGPDGSRAVETALDGEILSGAPATVKPSTDILDNTIDGEFEEIFRLDGPAGQTELPRTEVLDGEILSPAPSTERAFQPPAVSDTIEGTATEIFRVEGQRQIEGPGGKLEGPGPQGQLPAPQKQLGKPPLLIEGPASREAMRKAMRDSTLSDVSPVSPSQIVKDGAPEEARVLSQMAHSDSTGRAARATHASSQEDAVAKDLLPEPAQGDGSIPNKVNHDSGPQFEEPIEFQTLRQKEGDTALTDAEVVRVREKLVNGLEDVEGFNLRKESVVISPKKIGGVETGAAVVRAIYTPIDSGFRTVGRAIENSLYALRKYGVKEEDLTLYRRSGEKWVKTDRKTEQARDLIREAARKGKKRIPEEARESDYAVGMEFDYEFRPGDLNEWDMLGINRLASWMDQVMPTQIWAKLSQGSIVQNLMDSAMVLDAKRVIGPGVAAVDKGHAFKAMAATMFEKFAKGYAGLKLPRRVLMRKYIEDANFEGIRFSVNDLLARGFENSEIEMLREWRKSNDSMWRAANDDLGETLSSNGWGMFTHKNSDTAMVARGIQKGEVDMSTGIYDPVNGMHINSNDIDLDALYANKGEIVRTPEPFEVDGVWVEQIINQNTPDSGFIRRINRGDPVLSYREGYYPVMYDAKFFIRKEIRVGNSVRNKTIATVNSMEDLKAVMKQLQESDTEAVFNFRKDRRITSSRLNQLEDGSWSQASSSGMTMQRIRGKRLSDEGTDLHKMGRSNLVDPLEAVGQQIGQMSQRVSTRRYLETIKTRWMKNYGRYLDLPRDHFGREMTPANASKVVGKGGVNTKMVGEARTMLNHITVLENGYINGIDAGWKSVMSGMSDWMGTLGGTKLEKAFNAASKEAPMAELKMVTFKLLLGSNPFRQLVIQSAQNIQLLAINPKYVTTKMIPDLLEMTKAQYGWKASAEGTELWNDIRNSGVLQAIDSNSLVRSEMMRLADITLKDKALTLAGKPLDFLQKVGFDVAEEHVLIFSWMAHRDMAISAGKNFKSARVQEETLAAARAFTYNMNRGGEMAYNKNTLSLITQFFQVQHKAMSAMSFNKNLSVKDRVKLLGFNTVAFGVSATPFAALYALIPESVGVGGERTDNQQLLVDGLIDVAFNKVLSTLSGQDVEIDFSDLAPGNVVEMTDAFASIFHTNLMDAVANSPGGSMLFGGNPRISNVFGTAMRWFGFGDFEDPLLETNFSDVAIAAAHTFSGFSNAFKAYMAWQTGKKMSSRGNITDEDVSLIEAAGQLFGMRTKTESGTQRVKEIIYGDTVTAEMNEDMEKFWQELTMQLARKGQSVREAGMAQAVMNAGAAVFADANRFGWVEFLQSKLDRSGEQGDWKTTELLLQRAGKLSKKDMWEAINALPVGSHSRTVLTQVMKDIEEMK